MSKYYLEFNETTTKRNNFRRKDGIKDPLQNRLRIEKITGFLSK